MLNIWVISAGSTLLILVGYFVNRKIRQNKVQILSNVAHFIAKPTTGRRLVIPDIHGCSKTLKVLLENKMKIQLNDQLFFLGDYIGRGPDSKGVIDYIFALQKQGYQVYPLRGNHEQALLDKLRKHGNSKTRMMSYVVREKVMDLLNDHQRVRRRYVRFFEQLAHFYELDKYLLVHAGFNFSLSDPFQDKNSMLWTRHYTPDAVFLRGKQIVQGHMPTSLRKIMKSIEDKSSRLILDNGCVFLKSLKDHEKGKLGHLLCFDLDTQQVTMQRNIG